MTRSARLATVALAAVALIGAALFVYRSRDPGGPPSGGRPDAAEGAGAGAADETVKGAGNDTAGQKPAGPTLYCEFTDFADRTPLVGFYFLIEEATSPPFYALIFQREKDGTQSELPEAAPRPEWRFEGSEDPVVIRAPDDATQINVYDYDTKKPGVNWFEAGLRSVRYRNLGGRCRRSAA